MTRVRRRIGDKHVLTVVKAFLKAGILSEDTVHRETHTGTPQGGILSPLLANIALSVLDEHFAEVWQSMMATRVDRRRLRRYGQPTYRLVRYADDFVLMVNGTRQHAEALLPVTAAALAPVGLRLSKAKTHITHIDEGFTFLGIRIRRSVKRGTTKRYVYTYPPKDALASVKRKVKAISNQGTHQDLADILRQVNNVLRGWTNYQKAPG